MCSGRAVCHGRGVWFVFSVRAWRPETRRFLCTSLLECMVDVQGGGQERGTACRQRPRARGPFVVCTRGGDVFRRNRGLFFVACFRAISRVLGAVDSLDRTQSMSCLIFCGHRAPNCPDADALPARRSRVSFPALLLRTRASLPRHSPQPGQPPAAGASTDRDAHTTHDCTERARNCATPTLRTSLSLDL